ncbi:sialate O-acetylesterase [candidate division KSB1 bacterium]|nr:sialate O-acetylesterase [candidate division KSB1 bacterium]
MKIKSYVSIFIILILPISMLHADVRLPAVIGSNMVIQQNTDVPIWGWANAGEKITVKTSWNTTATSTIAGKNGKWLVKLKSPDAGGPHRITIRGKNEIVLQNVLSGEVWFASGQSNMAMMVKDCNDAAAEIQAADYPFIRFFKVNHTYAETPQSDCSGSWVNCTPVTVPDFSAVAYFFGRKIHKELNAPVGLIDASKGGSPAEAWMSKEAIDSEPEFTALYDMWLKWEKEYPDLEKTYNTNLQVWDKEKEQALAASKPAPEEPIMPEAVDMIEKPHRRPSALYNAMVAPVIPYAIKGVIWCQGGNNIDRPLQYRKLFLALIKSWREDWGRDNLPFYYVQNPPYRYKMNKNKASLLREAQAMAMALPYTGMAVTTDIGDLDNVHPKNKQDVGKRLALWALAKTYGVKDIVCSGPFFRSQKIENDRIRIFFDFIGSGLIKKGEKLTHFEIAGPDKKFYKAIAVIDDSTIVVRSDNVRTPVAVRFGWSITSMPNLFNKEGLPAAPFRTDNWE